MKFLNISFAILFIFFAALQYNDQDPYVWMPIYLYSAFICFLAFKNKHYKWMYITGLFIYISYAIYLFCDKTGVLNWVKEHDAENIVESMKATKPWIEETREFFGLLVLIIVLITNMIWIKKAAN